MKIVVKIAEGVKVGVCIGTDLEETRRWRSVLEEERRKGGRKRLGRNL